MSNEFSSLYEFGDFRFDTQSHTLWRGQELISLPPKALDVLCLLIESKGELVTKQEILSKVWADTFVEEGVLTQSIYRLRQALGTDSNGKQLIENFARRGYRLAIPVVCETQIDAESKTIEISEQNNTNSDRKQIPVFPRRRVAVSVFVAVALIILSSFFAYRYFRSNISSVSRKPIESVKFTQLTNTGDLTTATISPDGSLVAFTRGDKVFLKDITTEKEITLDIQNAESFSSLQFSPDGNFIYFRNNRILATQAKILRVSRLGGESQPIIERSWGSFSISPDGKKLAYFLNVPPIAKFNLRIRDLDTGNEKEFLAVEQPNSLCVSCSPAWSPDSKTIIYTTNISNGSGQMYIVDLEKDKREELKFDKLRRFEQVAWMPDGASFIVSATEGSRFFHLWKVFYPDLKVEPITNGLSNYAKVSITADGRKILSLRADETSNLFIANAENLNEQKQVTFGNQNSFGQSGLHWIDEHKILFSTQTEQNLADNLAVLNTEDNSKTTITSEKQNSFRVPVSNGKQIWFSTNKNGSSQIFQMDMNGKNIVQLTNGADGQRQSPRITNDSKYLFYVFRSKEGGKIIRFDMQNQTEEVFFNNPDFQPGPFLELSPDNKYLTFLRMRERSDDIADKFNSVMTVVSIENKDDIKFFPVSIIPPIRRFSPDSKYLDYIYAETDGTQIVRQSFDGSEPKPLLTISNEKIFNFAWSKNGKQLAISKGQQIRDAVLLTEFDK